MNGNKNNQRNGNGGSAARKAVELRLAVSYAHSRGDLLGIAKYSRLHGDWEFFGGPKTEKLAISPMPVGQPDGIIAQVTEPAMAEQLQKFDAPVVNISGALEHPPFPTVRVDDHAVGRLAAQHLLHRGFTRFLVVHAASKAFSRRRLEGFQQAVRDARPDAHCHVHNIDYNKHVHPIEYQRDVRRDLEGVALPVAIFAVTDFLAYLAMSACRDVNLRVPHDAAIIGVDNDPLTCELAAPPLSSVDINAECVGYRAAEMLDSLMGGQTPPKAPVLIMPVGVVTRRSTDVLAIDDPLVANALEYIHQRATDGIQVPGVAGDLDVSRRTLERRFRKALNCTPAEEIRRTRTAQAIRLLRETDLPIAEIATRCGFRYAQHLAPVIQDATGLTPTEFRRESRVT
ncbi:MAG: substrate-binding domain-containing protein [Phycisphaerae bacterium]